MYIGFNLDDTFYSGTATLTEKDGKSVYLVDLNESVHANAQFTIAKNKEGKWESGDAENADLVRAAGCEVDTGHEEHQGERLAPNNYYSAERSGGEPPVFRNGEVINEPDDVDENSQQA